MATKISIQSRDKLLMQSFELINRHKENLELEDVFVLGLLIRNLHKDFSKIDKVSKLFIFP